MKRSGGGSVDGTSLGERPSFNAQGLECASQFDLMTLVRPVEQR